MVSGQIERLLMSLLKTCEKGLLIFLCAMPFAYELLAERRVLKQAFSFLETLDSLALQPTFYADLYIIYFRHYNQRRADSEGG